MQREAFDAALRLIMPGPADQPLMRILKIALDISDCPMGTIGARREASYDVIVSCGLPLAGFAAVLPRSEAIADVLQVPRIIEDARLEPAFARHPFVTGPANWRFIASVPLPLTMLPYSVLLNCADMRVGATRAKDLLLRLEECAAIAADELRLIGDIAYQAEQLGEVRQTSGMRDEGVRTAGVPMALLAADGAIMVSNDRLAALTAHAGRSAPERLADIFPGDAHELALRLAAVIGDGRPAPALPARIPGSDRSFLVDLIRVTTMDSSEPRVLCTVTDRTLTLARADALETPATDPAPVVSDFLFDTLIWQKRLLRRGPVPYHALARWRAPVRDAQIAALRALKRDPGGYFLDQLTERMVAASQALFGRETFKAVAAVPCGNSGPNCLSERLGRRIAERLGVAFCNAFEPLPSGGSSHPMQNLRRAKMQLRAAPDVPLLLIDDVATSGAHIEEAALLLRRSAPAVLPLVWIAD